MKNFILTALTFTCMYVAICTAKQITDSGKLYTSDVYKVLFPTTIEDIQNIVKRAHQEQRKISIAGQRYSQGGQSHADDSFNIDLSNFNKLIKLDIKNKIATVQAGMTWEQLQNIIHQLGLSIKVMQSSNVFSIAGSASVNAHGRDLRYGSIIETIISCKIINSQGNIQNLSRTENPELFSLVIGGYGLFGIIVEIELSLIDNPICYKHQEIIPYQEYKDHLKDKILSHSNINLYYGRLVTIPGKNFLKKIISVAYTTDLISQRYNKQLTLNLISETNIEFNQRLFNFYRKHPTKIISWLRHIIETQFPAPWETRTYSCRNQLMRPYIHSLKNTNSHSTDLLQEYFIPLEKFTEFTDQLRHWSQFYNIKLLNVTLRFVPQNNESFLSYATTDMIAFVIYFSTNIDKDSITHIKKYSKHLIDACLHCHGTFYLPYQQFATAQQIHTCYPQLQDLLTKKSIYDPEHIFVSNWFSTYIQQL